MKIGDKAVGFRFDGFNNSANMNYNTDMNEYIDIEGTIVNISEYHFDIDFIINDCKISWSYPIKEYLSVLRDMKLKELGI